MVGLSAGLRKAIGGSSLSIIEWMITKNKGFAGSRAKEQSKENLVDLINKFENAHNIKIKL